MHISLMRMLSFSNEGCRCGDVECIFLVWGGEGNPGKKFKVNASEAYFVVVNTFEF